MGGRKRLKRGAQKDEEKKKKGRGVKERKRSKELYIKGMG